MKQQTLAVAADNNAQYEQYRRPTKRDVFLATMEQMPDLLHGQEEQVWGDCAYAAQQTLIRGGLKSGGSVCF